MADVPLRADVWIVDLDPVRGHEQAGRRPGLIVSADPFNRNPLGLVLLVPITTQEKGFPSHVEVRPPDGGLRRRSFIKCEDVRSLAKERLVRRLGRVSSTIMNAVEHRLRLILDL